MPPTLPARRPRLLAAAVLAGTTAVAGPMLTAPPAAAAPVGIAGTVADVPAGTPATGPEHYFTPVALSNGDTGYGIDEDQPLAPLGQDVLDDEHYAVAEAFDDPDGGWTQVVGEKAGGTPVYWEPGNAALAGYILSVFGATEDADEALAVSWAVRSLSTAVSPDPELSGLERSHLERAAFLIEDAERNVPVLQGQEDGAISADTAPDGSPERLLVELPQAYYTTTVTLSGPVTFADGTRERTFAGGDRQQVLDLAVPAGTTAGELTVTVTATTPSTELTVLAHDRYRDLLIAGQDRELSWSANTDFAIDGTPAPDSGAPAGDEADDGGAGQAPGADPVAGNGGTAEDPDTADGADELLREPSGNATVPQGPAAEHGTTPGPYVPVVVVAPEAVQRVTATVDAFVLFEESVSTHTETVTETTTTVSGSAALASGGGVGYGSAYADAVTASTGTGAMSPVGNRQGLTTVLLAALAAGAGLGSWALRRRRPVEPDPTS